MSRLDEITRTLQEIKAENKSLREVVEQLKCENSVLRNEILGIGISEATNSQRMGLIENKTLRQIVEETQFHVKVMDARMLEHVVLKEITHETKSNDNAKPKETENASQELSVVELRIKESMDEIKTAITCGDGKSLEETIHMRELHRYYHPNGNHFYTVENSSEVRNKLAASKFMYEGFVGKIFNSPQNGVVPLHRYFNGKDHFYTTNFGELGGGKNNYAYERIEGYVFASQTDGTKPLYRYYNSKLQDHFYTPNWAELEAGKNGYVFEQVQAYIFP